MLLSGGWTLAAARQPHGYDAVRDTISALAARGATDRWVMTAALAGLGACHVITATGLRPAHGAGRMVLAFGRCSDCLGRGVPRAFAGKLGGSPGGRLPRAYLPRHLAGLRRTPGARGAAANSDRLRRRHGGLARVETWFAVELRGGQTGSAERAAAGAQALWPLAVVLSTRRGPRPQPLGRT